MSTRTRIIVMQGLLVCGLVFLGASCSQQPSPQTAAQMQQSQDNIALMQEQMNAQNAANSKANSDYTACINAGIANGGNSTGVTTSCQGILSSSSSH